ncbi:STAS/SEC14 domain-containing protein [Salinimicrobium flavum]|uniref:STAS/SEC14 domain-containing protein n=1 Tax=Salinimicrobium flavum TaxID=1737065 RepID=A0ABW5J196_9FLAO
MINLLELDFATIRIYDKLIVTECNEGVLLDVPKNRKVLELAGEIFNNEDFGYISNRVNSYAVDPMVYRESAEHPQLKAIAVVSTSELARKTAQLEQKFYTNKNPFQIFNDLEEAKSWIKEAVMDQSKVDSSSW